VARKTGIITSLDVMRLPTCQGSCIALRAFLPDCVVNLEKLVFRRVLLHEGHLF
jgi:hypothetical protein